MLWPAMICRSEVCRLQLLPWPSRRLKLGYRTSILNMVAEMKDKFELGD